MKLFCLCCRNAAGSARALVGAIKADDYVSVRGALQEQAIMDAFREEDHEP